MTPINEKSEKWWGFYLIITLVILVFAWPIWSFLFWDLEEYKLWVMNMWQVALWLVWDSDEDLIKKDLFDQVAWVNENGTMWFKWIIILFTNLFWIIFIIFLLFTPTKNAKSPIWYLAEDTDNKIKAMWQSSDDDKNNGINPEKWKKNAVDLWLLSILVIAVTASYLYVVRMISASALEWDLVHVITWWVTAALIIVWTSLIIKKLEEIDPNKWEEEERKKYLYTWAMLVVLIIAFAISFVLTSKFEQSNVVTKVERIQEWEVNQAFD